MKTLLSFLILAVTAVSTVAQDHTDHVRIQDEEERAYCRFLVEQGKATSILLRTPQAESGVTQPSTGTAPQVYVGATGSLANLRKAGLTDKVAQEGCKLFTLSANALDSIKYALPTLEQDIATHRMEAINTGITQLDGFITQSLKLVDTGNATRLSLYELQEARTRLITERYALQLNNAILSIPEISHVPLYQQVAAKQTQEGVNQAAQVKLQKQNTWDVRWQVGVHKGISGIGPITNSGLVSSTGTGAYLGFDATWNIGARKANKALEASAKDYIAYKKMSEDDVVVGADQLQAVVLNEIAVADKKLRQIAEQRKKLDENVALVKDANTPTAAMFLNQLNADEVTLNVELSDTRYRRQMFQDYLARNWPKMQDSGRGRVSLTFDDGYASAFNIALPIMEQAGLKSTWYIITRDLGKNKSYMTDEDVKRLAARGEEVGSHTESHKHLPTLSATEQTEEIAGSIKDFAAMGIKPVTFAYPFGERNDDSVSIVRTNFQAGRTVDRNAPEGDAAQLPSLSLTNKTTIGELKVAIDNARRDGTWLILTFHRIDEGDNEYSVSHETLQWVVDYLKSNNTQVVTVDEATRPVGTPSPQTKQPIAAAKPPILDRAVSVVH